MNVAKVLFDLYRLKQNEKKSVEQMKKIQERKLRKLLSYAWEHSDFYHRTFTTAGITKGQLSILPLSAFPTINKFVITILTGSKLLVMEQKDMGIYRSFGFTAIRLRISFALRFGIVSFIGTLIGMLCSAFFTDMLVAALLRRFGISNFSSHLTVGNTLFPVWIVMGAFLVFAWLVAGKIKTDKLTVLVAK